MRYLPLKLPIDLRASQSGLMSLNMGRDTLIADFAIPDDPQALLVVKFQSFELFRVLDEMPLFTEPESEGDGAVPDHLAYEMEGAYFWNVQSEAFRTVHAEVRHYRFIPCDLALDVLTYSPPLISIERRDPLNA